MKAARTLFHYYVTVITPAMAAPIPVNYFWSFTVCDNQTRSILETVQQGAGVGGTTVGYYETVAASYGLQAGAQSFGYALFFMTDKDLDFLKSSDGWEVGVGPSVVVMDKGKANDDSVTDAAPLKKSIGSTFSGDRMKG